MPAIWTRPNRDNGLRPGLHPAGFLPHRNAANIRGTDGTTCVDFRRGRIDSAVHPFTWHISAATIADLPCVMTNAISPPSSRCCCVNWGGAGFSRSGLPPARHGPPDWRADLAERARIAARLWENAVGRSLGFWRYLLPRIETAFPAVPRPMVGGAGHATSTARRRTGSQSRPGRRGDVQPAYCDSR